MIEKISSKKLLIVYNNLSNNYGLPSTEEAEIFRNIITEVYDLIRKDKIICVGTYGETAKSYIREELIRRNILKRI